MKKTWLRRMTVVIAFILAMVLACPAFAEAAEGKTFTYVTGGDAGNIFNPFGINDRNKVLVAAPMLAPLYRTDAAGNMIPILAESIEPSEDGLTYTLKLKEGLKWSDGEAITADDVVFTYNTLNALTPQYYINGQPYQAEKVDELTVAFKLPAVSASFVELLWYNIFLAPQHIYEGKESYDVNMLEEDVVGCGAYILEEYVTGQYYKYRSNPDYALGEPDIDTLVYQIVPSNDTAAYAMLNGEANAWVVPAEYSDEFIGNDSFNLRSYTTGSVHYLQLNRVADAMQDQNYRAGLFKALDRKEIMDAGYASEERYELNASSLPLSNPYHTDDIETYEQDVEEAKKLVAGGATTLKLAYIAGRDFNEREALVIQAQLAQIGIHVEIYALDSAAYMAASYDPTNKDYDMYICTYVMGNDPDMYASLFDPAMGNYLNFNSEEIVEKFNQGREELDNEKRIEIYKEAQQLVAEEALIYPFGSDMSVLATTKDVVGADTADMHSMHLFLNWTQLSMN